MVRIVLYGYATGVCSSRMIERKCVDDVPFRWLAAGMVSLGRVALGGTKVRANASKRKAMSCARMSKKE
jgi:transposase